MRMTVRTKLTVLYGAMVVVGGLLLVLAVYLLVRANLVGQLTEAITPRMSAVATIAADPAVTRMIPAEPIAMTSTDTVLTKLLLVSGVSLLVLAVIAVAVGWWVSGRVLRPLHRMSATARRLSSDNLHERIALSGPRDELTELADTFDAMLERLEAAFSSQRRFIANASHELRTPLAIQRAAVQIGLAGEQSEAVARVSEQLLDANRRSERLIDGLLVLARSDQGLEHREPVPLHKIAAQEVEQHTRGEHLDVVRQLEECWVLGDPVLITQLVGNLVGNAVRHNVDGGQIRVRTGNRGLHVANTGPVLHQDQVPELFEPFRRGSGRTRSGEGAGLGLSIVQSIARAHGGTVRAVARGGGGLAVHVTFPGVGTAVQSGHTASHGGAPCVTSSMPLT